MKKITFAIKDEDEDVIRQLRIQLIEEFGVRVSTSEVIRRALRVALQTSKSS
jgi:Arc/MetJ-type ribon-helix-helix transcriptional regulator